MLPALATACASARHDADPVADLERRLAQRSLAAELAAPMRLTAEVESWARGRLASRRSLEEHPEQLLKDLLARTGPPFVYASGATAGAVEVWQSGRANCLSFSHLLVAVARELGIEAYYLRVHDLSGFDKEGDLVITSEHVTAAWGPAPMRQVLDFSADPVRDYRRIEQISDDVALALHYSNLGAQRIRAGDLAEAVRQLGVAVRIAPELPDAWINLGVARRRSGDLAGAEEAYRRALTVDPEALSAYHNLSGLLVATGRPDEAASLASLAEGAGARNPWSYLALGELALHHGALADAGRLLHRAYRLAPGEVEIVTGLGKWAVAAGDVKLAQRLLRRAQKLDAEHARVKALAQSLVEMN